MEFQKFLDKNRECIYKLAEDNTHKNDEDIVVINFDDEWRKESEWEDLN